ncbi:MAG: hypothetical protein ACE5SW_07665, partial [Nitrososphaeraceae archaeon]
MQTIELFIKNFPFRLYLIIFILILTCFSQVQIDDVYSIEIHQLNNITVVAGWTNEIPILNQKNEIKIVVTDNQNNSPIENALEDVNIRLTNGNLEEKISVNKDNENPGIYTIYLIPSKVGTHFLSLTGTILNNQIDLSIPLEEVKDITKTAYPILPTLTTDNATTNLTTSEMTPLTTTTNDSDIDQDTELLSFPAVNESSTDNATTAVTTTNLTTSEMTPLTTTTNDSDIDQDTELLSFPAVNESSTDNATTAVT